MTRRPAPHGGRRPGAGRPRGTVDPASRAFRWPAYRATEDEEGRRVASGMTPTERLRAALALLAEREDAG